MLDAFIIEELRRKERRQEREAERPQLPVPAPSSDEDADDHPRQSDDDKPQRGVVIIDYSV